MPTQATPIRDKAKAALEAMRPELDEAIQKAVSEQLDTDEWAGDASPPTEVAFDEALYNLLGELIENGQNPPERNVEVSRMTSDGRPDTWAVFVDGCFRGTCGTESHAERMAQLERQQPESVEEKGLRLLRESGEFDDYEVVAMVHTGGGCLAGEIRKNESEPAHAWLTEAAGFVEEDVRAGREFLVGGYFDSDEEQLWVEDFNGICDVDDLVATVKKALAAASELANKTKEDN